MASCWRALCGRGSHNTAGMYGAATGDAGTQSCFASCKRLFGGARQFRAASCSTTEVPPTVESALPEEDIMTKIQILPHGVLGAQLKLDGSIVEHGVPDSNTVIVDPAGLHHIQPPGGPSGAGGAAGAIYKYLGIAKDLHFAPDVVQAIKKTGDAKYHSYGPGKEVIHAVGPDLRMGGSAEQALQELSSAYANIFKEFVDTDFHQLWFLPVSSGIFAGPFKRQMPQLTMVALRQGFACLSDSQRENLSARELKLCIFMESELQAFQVALQAVPPKANL